MNQIAKSAAYIVTTALLFCGCSTIETKTQPSDAASDIKHQLQYAKVFTQFYCEKKRWPLNMEEADSFAKSRNLPHDVNLYKNAEYSSPNLAELIFEWKNQSKAHKFIASLCKPCDPNERIYCFVGGQLKMLIPDGFNKMDSDMVEQRFASRPLPHYTYTDNTQQPMLAIQFSSTPLSDNLFESMKQQLEYVYERTCAGHKWLSRNIIDINGTRWIHLEKECDTPCCRLYSDMYFTAIGGKIASIYFHLPANKVSEYGETIRKIKESLQVDK